MALPAARLALDEFLAWENTQATRHGFFRGEVFARVGARRSHGTVVGNLMRTCWSTPTRATYRPSGAMRPGNGCCMT